ncbi:MAG: aromatic amino acid lyase [Bacteroidia bacterium]|nr:aromatic amino acid lyase [Bacteroidia bacterium]
MEQYSLGKKEYLLEADALKEVSGSFDFLAEFSKNKIIYGINTGFGPMAQYKIESHLFNELQYNLIRSHSCGIGAPLDEVYVRSILLARLNSFLQGNSGVSPELVKQLVSFLNNKINPEIYEHGGVGASGDLVQLAHLGLNLIGEGFVYVDGKRVKTAEALAQKKVKPLALQLRDGLAIINGTSCMTGIASINLIYSYRLLDWAIMASSIINEVVESFDDSFSEGLNKVKMHKGQREVAARMRAFLSGSTLIRNREELFVDEKELSREKFEKKIQEYYSIRCVPQILGPILDTLEYSKLVIENELNSCNDNPIVVPEENNVYHGGNFHGDYISLEMDKLKIAITKLTVLADRQLNYLLNHRLNKKFPPFLNSKKLGFNFGLQGLQFTATSTTAENQALCSPMYVHSIPSNHDNQDVVSMGTNSALMAKQVVNNSFQVMSILLMGICQAIDLLTPEEKAKLSAKTIKVFDLIRTKTSFIEDDKVQSEILKEVFNFIKENPVSI